MKEVEHFATEINSACIGKDSKAKENYCIIGDGIDIDDDETMKTCVAVKIKDITIVIGETVFGKSNDINKSIKELLKTNGHI